MKSGKQISNKHGDPLVKTEWYWMKNSREALKEESRVLKRYGGHKSSLNYNERDSPGTKYIAQDGTP